MYFSNKFMTASACYTTVEKNVPAPYIRRVFSCTKHACAELTITGLGFYKLYINGTDITKGLLSPYISNSEDIVYYDHYDISSYLLDGENVIGIILGNGMQNAFGGFVWDFDKTPFRSAPMFALALELDGTLVLEADESFLTYPSPILEDDLRLGEKYDARKEITGWNLPGFADTGWEPVRSTKAPTGEKRLSCVRPIRCQKKVKPVRFWQEEDGFVYDFGINTAGTVQLRVLGAAGQKIRMVFGEILKDGRFYWENTSFIRPEYEHMRVYRQEDTYICRGSGEEFYEPSFTYHGFQYVKVYGITKEQAEEGLLTMCIYHTDLDINGEFVCSDFVLNALQSMTVNSTLSNFYHFPTDCPQREKNGWTADAALSAEQTMLNFAPVDNYKEWLRNVCKAQAEDGSLPGIVPTWGWGFAWGNGPAWDCVITEIPYAVYKYTGDTEIIQICREAMLKYLRYLETKKDKNGLLAFGLGDWEDPSGEGDTYQAPLELTDSIYAMHIAGQCARLMQVIGEDTEAAYCLTFHEQLRTGIREHLLDKETMTFSGDCQTSQAMGIYYGVLNPTEEEKAFAVLEQQIRRDREQINSGVLGLKVIFHVLAAHGRADLAYDMITKETPPSYGYWVKKGNTTLEEYMQDTRSANHHFMGDVSAWFYRCICGIEYDLFAGQEDRLHIRPTLFERIEHAKAYICTKDGRICVEYEKRGTDVVLEAEIPKNINAVFELPHGWCDPLGRSSFTGGSGKYRVTRREQHEYC